MCVYVAHVYSFAVGELQGHAGAVKLLSQLSAVFGQTAFSEVWMHVSQTCSDMLEQGELFKQDLFLWCLDGNHDIDSKVEFLLVYLGWADFEVEWKKILLHVIPQDGTPQEMNVGLGAKQILNLAALVRHVRAKVNEFQAHGDTKMASLVLREAQNGILDAAALSLVRTDLANPLALQLLQ